MCLFMPISVTTDRCYRMVKCWPPHGAYILELAYKVNLRKTYLYSCICCHHSWSIQCVWWAWSLLGESGIVIQLGILLHDLNLCLLQFWELRSGNQKLPMAVDTSLPISMWNEASWGSGHWPQWGWGPGHWPQWGWGQEQKLPLVISWSPGSEGKARPLH